MSWQERFRSIRRLADEQQRQEKEQMNRDRKSAEGLVNERRKVVRSLSPRIERVCKQFNRGVKGKMRPYKVDDWGKGNVAWRLQMNFGGVEVETWPWLYEISKPRLLRGIWLQYLGIGGEELVSEAKVKGTRLGHYYELGREGASSSGYYYWIQTRGGVGYDYHTGPCIFGYFLSVGEFSEETLATILEEIGYDLVKRLSRHDFSRIG